MEKHNKLALKTNIKVKMNNVKNNNNNTNPGLIFEEVKVFIEELRVIFFFFINFCIFVVFC